MSRIHLKRRHKLGRDKARVLVDRLREDLSREHEFEGEWVDQVLHVSRTGAKGDIEVSDDAVEIKVELSMLLRPWRDKICHGIEAHLDELFPDA